MNKSKMKKAFFGFMLFFVCLHSGKGQQLHLTAFSGYTFQDRLRISDGRAKISGGHTYGGLFTVVIRENMEIELLYSRQDAMASAYSSTNDIDMNEPVSVNYIVAGGNRLFNLSDKFTGFTGGKIGAGIIASKNDYFNTITKFSIHLNAGVKYFVTPLIGIRIQGNLAFPLVNVGGSLWWSPGGGTQVGISSWSPILQFGLTGGLIFRLM